MRIALVHYWLVRMRGGEAVIKQMLDVTPEADVYTNVYNAEGVKELFAGRDHPQTTWVDKLPLARKAYPLYMPLMPSALEQLNLSDYDLVISSEAGPAKWVIPSPSARHLCYVHSPMRYLWDQRFVYRDQVPWAFRPVFDVVTERLREKDLISAGRVDEFIANSSFVADRIKRYYRRDAVVIHPPVEVADFGPPVEPEDFYLWVGQLVSYKNIRHAVDACVRMGRRLVVVGDGSGRKYVEGLADKGVEYRGRVSREEMMDLMRRCRALLFPGLEDFGIVPVEVLAAGRPVIAYGKGGVVDSVTHGETGFFYGTPTVEALMRAIEEFEEWEPQFDPAVAQAHSRRFSAAAFREKWGALIGR